jgi:glyoxylase I family protein
MTVQVRDLTALVQVFDMAASVAFYRDLLGFEIVAQSRPGDSFDWAWLKKAGASLMLNTAYEAHRRPAVPDPVRRAGHADTTFFLDCADVDEAYDYLRSKGLAVEPPVVRDYGMKQLNVTDPDGYGLCFQCPAEPAIAKP